MEQKRGEAKKAFKKGGKPGQGVCALKRGTGIPLRTMSSGQGIGFPNQGSRFAIMGFPKCCLILSSF